MRDYLSDPDLARWLFFIEPRPASGASRIAAGRSWRWDGDEWHSFRPDDALSGVRVPEMTYDEVMEIGREGRKTEAMMPTWRDVESAFGEKAAETGTVNLDLRTRDGKKNRGKMLDMLAPVWARQQELAMRRTG